jgi:hypothetical protein
MTERQLKEHQVQIARYRFLEREVTDPLSVCLIQTIIEELEADLRKHGDAVECEIANASTASK